MTKKDIRRSNKWIFGVMLAFGITGLLASFVLAVEEFHLIKNPDAVLTCSFNAILNCASVMKTWQASVFGFPNMFIGLMAYPVVITVAVVALADAALPKWFWRLAHVGFGLGLVFAYWLFFNSLYAIEILCPWCLVVTFSTTILFEALTRYVLRENIWGFNGKARRTAEAFIAKDIDKVLVAAWVVLLVGLVIAKFGTGLLG